MNSVVLAWSDKGLQSLAVPYIILYSTPLIKNIAEMADNGPGKPSHTCYSTLRSVLNRSTVAEVNVGSCDGYLDLHEVNSWSVLKGRNGVVTIQLCSTNAIRSMEILDSDGHTQ
ncbi:hypothetical protein AKJ16_DCAP01097 [Drosera capensis]